MLLFTLLAPVEGRLRCLRLPRQGRPLDADSPLRRPAKTAIPVIVWCIVPVSRPAWSAASAFRAHVPGALDVSCQAVSDSYRVKPPVANSLSSWFSDSCARQLSISWLESDQLGPRICAMHAHLKR